MPNIWQQCLIKLEASLSSEDMSSWILPIQAQVSAQTLTLNTPNKFVKDLVIKDYLASIKAMCNEFSQGEISEVVVLIGTQTRHENSLKMPVDAPYGNTAAVAVEVVEAAELPPNLDPNYTFAHFVEGKSNEIARAAALQIANNPSNGYNPLLICGGVGLGKTHLMHAVGHSILAANPKARVAYIHSERFYGDMVTAIQHNKMSDFKRIYRTIDMLLVDDIQFFAGKPRSQEEFFHTFNALMERKQQIILTCDRYPKEIEGLEDRLKSRFAWGLTVAIDAPELEERVAILQSKAEQARANVPNEVAFYIAKHISSNVRDLEGAMRNVIATSQFTGKPIDLEFAKHALRDLIASHDKIITIDNIQKTIANYYKIRVSDLLGKGRKRQITRPRQIAMALAKKLTNHSLPEIGEAFGGRDHSTVLHAVRQVKTLRQQDALIQEDYKNLLRILTS